MEDLRILFFCLFVLLCFWTINKIKVFRSFVVHTREILVIFLFLCLFVLLCFWTILSDGPAYYIVDQTNATECTCKALGFFKLSLIVVGPIVVISMSLLGLETGKIKHRLTNLTRCLSYIHACNII